MASTAVIGPLDPGDDRDSQILAGDPDVTVKDVLLQQAEERLHGGVVPGSTDPTHRSDHGMTGKGTYVFPTSKLRSAVGMEHAAGAVTTPGDGVVQCVDCDRGFHPRVDRITDDTVGEHVLDRTNVQFAFKCSMLGDVRQPQFVSPSRGEVSLDAIVMHRRTDLAALASFGLFADCCG